MECSNVWSLTGVRCKHCITVVNHRTDVHHLTSNMTTIIEVRSATARLSASMWRPLVSVITTLLCCEYFSSSRVVSRAFSVLCMYLKFGHHPHPIGYLCVKFCFFRSLHCWASPSRKIAYSITHWITYPAYLIPREPCLEPTNKTESILLYSSAQILLQLIILLGWMWQMHAVFSWTKWWKCWNECEKWTMMVLKVL